MIKIKLFLAFLLGISLAKAQSSVLKLSSPNKKMKVEVYEKAGILCYSLVYNEKEILAASELGLGFSKPVLNNEGFQIIDTDEFSSNQTWKPVWGEVAQIQDHFNALRVKLRNRQNLNIIVEFRAYNEGLAFRYIIPEQANYKHFIVADEYTSYQLTGNHKAFWIPGDYDTNEYLYNTTPLAEIDALKAAAKEKDIALQSVINENTVQVPLMMKTADNIYINIHEAALRNFPVMYLSLDKNKLNFKTTLAPDAVGNKAYIQTPFNSPWRVIHVSDKAEEMLASKMILNLNEPSVIENTEWIKPQKFIGMWWEMHVGKANWYLADGKHGARTENVKTYIDFAAEHGFDGVLVEGWNVGWEDWFGHWKEDVFDFVSPYPDYDIDQLSQYAQYKGVKIIMHHETSGAVSNYERRMDDAFTYMKDHEMNTVKTGYVGKIIPRGEHHDGQWMVNHYERVAQKAAQYQIMVEAHEPAHPTGLHRTYPNWLANEAARGNEFNNAPTLGLVPEHETILPFTRLMGGPMDYTPGFFHFKLNQYDSTRTTAVRTTLAKQLALYVVIYSPLQMAGDFPENFMKHPGAFQFIKDVPVDWSETKILAAEPGDYVAIARKDKASQNWYLGAISDENERELNIDFGFLKPNTLYEAIIYEDADNAHWDTNPTAYRIRKVKISQKEIINFRLAPGGGLAIQLLEL